MPTLTMTQPDDWHLHLRSGTYLSDTVPPTADVFGRAIVMPNLAPPVTDIDHAARYRDDILRNRPASSNFTPLMTLYLTDNTSPETIRKAVTSGIIHGVKLYPAGATTNSDAGVTDIHKVYDTLETMEEHRLPLLIHGEVTRPEVDIFDREKQFIDDVLVPITQKFPQLRIVLEHVTTADAVQYVRDSPAHVGATITAHHLLYNRNDMLVGGIKPHFYCLPILKREHHRHALINAATSGNPKFFLGTDSAPHPKTAKESACGCAGCFTSFAALPLYAEAFESAGKLDKLEGFASFFGADFYGLPRNKNKITLVKEAWTVPEYFKLGNDQVIPLRASSSLAWKVLQQT